MRQTSSLSQAALRSAVRSLIQMRTCAEIKGFFASHVQVVPPVESPYSAECAVPFSALWHVHHLCLADVWRTLQQDCWLCKRAPHRQAADCNYTRHATLHTVLVHVLVRAEKKWSPSPFSRFCRKCCRRSTRSSGSGWTWVRRLRGFSARRTKSKSSSCRQPSRSHTSAKYTSSFEPPCPAPCCPYIRDLVVRFLPGAHGLSLVHGVAHRFPFKWQSGGIKCRFYLVSLASAL